MSYFDAPPGQPVLREFMIHRDLRGRWVASEIHGLSEGVFSAFKEAFRFACAEADGDTDRVHVEPTRLRRF